MKESKKEKSKISHWTDIRKVLEQCSERDLRGLIGELYSLSKTNKDFLDARFLKDQKAQERYKAQIKKYISPNEPWKSNQQISLKSAKKILSDYKKATGDKIGLIDLMIYYVECGTDFLCEFGDMYEQYYNSLESVFDDVIRLMKEFPDYEIESFIERLRMVVKKAHNMGWGYYDYILRELRKSYPSP